RRRAGVPERLPVSAGNPVPTGSDRTRERRRVGTEPMRGRCGERAVAGVRSTIPRTMTTKMYVLIVLGGVVAFALWFVFLAGAVDYPAVDVRNVDRDRLFLQTEQLLRDSEA